jgi:hypothetical protein
LNVRKRLFQAKNSKARFKIYHEKNGPAHREIPLYTGLRQGDGQNYTFFPGKRKLK